MSYHCEILADSENISTGDRLTTFLVTFPRMVLADMTRHRCLSYSFESTRAVPIEARIEMVRNNPFVPRMRSRAKGMAQGKFLEGQAKASAEAWWRASAEDAAGWAGGMLDLEKGIAGRLLEPFSWVTGVISGTEWDNFFNLRCHTAAQYELQIIAQTMLDQYTISRPCELRTGDWHLPFITPEEKYADYLPREFAEASAGRCAAISYLKHRQDETIVESKFRWDDKLAPSYHWSPGEHPAQAVDESWSFGSGYTGFKQLRKFYPGNEIARNPS